MRFLLIFLFFFSIGTAQTNTYTISFENAAHHEASVKAHFPDLSPGPLRLRMSRTSPGRYALHEFAKNVYGVRATNSKGEKLDITRPDPYSWEIAGHDGTVNFEYVLFGNRADGTYTQIDLTHAHLNIPATFIYSEDLKERPIEVNFVTSNHPGWKVATQLKHLQNNTYYAPNLYYFMDSPTEISNFDMQQFRMGEQNIKFVLHHEGSEQELKDYVDQVKKIVKHQKAVFGELPNFDFGEYTFLACYMPQVSGDGMEHRNSTVLTSTLSLAGGGMDKNIGTVSHEFFHAWNVERIRPESLEPFDFTGVNMSGALWFAEGFTSYYTNLTLSRAGLITPGEYVERLNGTFNYVWTSPARDYFSPVEMSYQAAFVDAATSVDPVNRENTFISYYSYGSVLGLALDLKLRQNDLNLDDFMKLMWEKYGRSEVPYELKDLQQTLAQYAGEDFAKEFFSNYIYQSNMPDYKQLFASVGLKLARDPEKAFFGTSVMGEPDEFIIAENPAKNSPAYKAGLAKEDKIISVNNTILDRDRSWEEEFKKYSPGDTLELKIDRYGRSLKKNIILEADPEFIISIDNDAAPQAVKAREAWLLKK